MQSKIKQITLQDGKQLFYPSEEEILKVNDQIQDYVMELTMSSDEYEAYMAHEKMLNDAATLGLGISYIAPKDYYSQNGDGE